MRGADRRLAGARAWQRSGLLDRAFYGALRGRSFRTDLRAALDLVDHGMPQRLSPHPLLDLLSLPDPVEQAYRRRDVGAVLAHLGDGAAAPRPVGPLVALGDRMEGLRAHMLVVAGRLGGSVVPPTTLDKSQHHGHAAPPLREPGLTSVLVGARTRRVIRAARSVLDQVDQVDQVEDEDRPGGPVELLLVDRGWPPLVELGLHAWATARCAALPRETSDGWSWAHGTIRLLASRRSPGDGEDWATRAGAAARGDVVVVLDGGLVVRSGWLAELRAALAEPGAAVVQPLLLGRDDMIVSAGTSGPPDHQPLLGGHPKEDALRLTGRTLPGLDPRARAYATVVAPRGGAPREPAGRRIAPRALLSAPDPAPAPSRGHPAPDSWADLGLADPRGELEPAQDGLHPRLRWSLNLPSPPGAFGDTWGDTHYAEALARALRRRDQDVVTRRRGAHASGPVELDHVALALRGRVPVPPVEGRCNVLWVISHPEDVEPEELEPFDVVCAASTVWSAEIGQRSGREVVPLLQATEFTCQEPARDDPASVVFVGTNLGRQRPLVWQAVEAGVPLSVYGPGWEGLPAGVWKGQHVANHRLPALYSSHGIVLADHWADMARHGFVANRVFDAVACGARVIADDVRGIRDVFDPDEVSVARDAADVRRLVEDLRRRPRTARHRPGLSFDDRSATLLDLVSARLGA